MTPFVAVVVVLLALFGAGLALVGSFGLLRLRSFYERAHPATLAATLGATSILLAAFLFFSASAGRVLPKALLLIVFIPLVSPVTTMLLARAALSRDRAKRRLTAAAAGSADEDWLREAEELGRAQAEAAKQQAVDAGETDGGQDAGDHRVGRDADRDAAAQGASDEAPAPEADPPGGGT